MYVSHVFCLNCMGMGTLRTCALNHGSCLQSISRVHNTKSCIWTEGNAAYLTLGTRMLLMPPSLTLILRQRLESVCGDGLKTFLDCTHCVATPRRVSPTRLTSAVVVENTNHKVTTVPCMHARAVDTIKCGARTGLPHYSWFHQES